MVSVTYIYIYIYIYIYGMQHNLRIFQKIFSTYEHRGKNRESAWVGKEVRILIKKRCIVYE